VHSKAKGIDTQYLPQNTDFQHCSHCNDYTKTTYRDSVSFSQQIGDNITKWSCKLLLQLWKQTSLPVYKIKMSLGLLFQRYDWGPKNLKWVTWLWSRTFWGVCYPRLIL